MYRHDERLKDRVEQTVMARNDLDLAEVMAGAFAER